MITSHLTDTEIQLYVAEPQMIREEIAAHINYCARCRSWADNYTLLFSSLQHTAQPAFNFDLAELVMADLPQKKVPYVWLTAVLGSLGALLILLAIALFGGRLAELFTSLPSSLLWLMVLPALVLVAMQVIVISNDYQRKMSVLVNS
jgi:hypothetical protein